LKKILFILLVLIPVSAVSQRARVRNMPEHEFQAVNFGFTLGLNTMDFRIKHSDFAFNYRDGQLRGFYGEVSTLTPGFNINIISNFRLSNHFDFRILPGVAFGQRRIDFYSMPRESGVPGGVDWDGRSEPILTSSQSIESSYLEFPFIFTYKAVRINNYKPYLLGGVNFRYDLAKNFSPDDGVFLSLNSFDTYAEIGFGIGYYLPFFKFSTELKYAIGFIDVLNRRAAPGGVDESRYQNSIESLYANLIILSFHFE
jgi:hypothetical protein